MSNITYNVHSLDPAMRLDDEPMGSKKKMWLDIDGDYWLFNPYFSQRFRREAQQSVRSDDSSLGRDAGGIVET
jgi:hypothetical protein